MKNAKLPEYVSKILKLVELGGDKALLRYTLRFDGIKLAPGKIQVNALKDGILLNGFSPSLKAAFDKSALNIKKFHLSELRNIDLSWRINQNGTITGQDIRPVESVGIYVPGGRYSYPSTVLMTAIPARAAGVKNIVIVTPPKNITPELIYAAKISGVNAIYRVGGPWAVAALAFGTQSVPKVDLIVGPGNKYVNEAKRQVFGNTGIDSLAGPSEIAVIADDTANESFIAQDILSQLEHDPDARAYFYTDSLRLFRGVNNALYGKADKKQIKAVKCSIPKAVELVNALAPEHLEIAIKNARKTAAKIKNAGAVFIGNYSPVAAGDYWAGPSHTLPTGRAARFSSGVSVSTFLKRTSYIELSKRSFLRGAKFIKDIAAAEGLIQHRKSIEIREKQNEN